MVFKPCLIGSLKRRQFRCYQGWPKHLKPVKIDLNKTNSNSVCIHLDTVLHDSSTPYGRVFLDNLKLRRHSIYAYYIHAFMSNTYYDLREVLKYKNFSSYAVTVFLCSVKNTILNTILRIEFWIVCIVGFCLVFSCFYHCWCMWCTIVVKMLNTLWVSIIIIVCTLFILLCKMK